MKKRPATSFGSFAEQWDKMSGESGAYGNMPAARAITELTGDPKGKRIYDIACGNGFLARQLVRRGAKEVWASDVAIELIELAQARQPDTIKYFVKEAWDFRGIPENYFDDIVILHGLFYIRAVEELIRGVHQALKPGGAFVFSLLHPLFAEGRAAMHEATAMGEPLKTRLEVHEKYLRPHTSTVTRQWGRIRASYLIYQRPLSFYLNLCAKYGLYIIEVRETKSQRQYKQTGKKGRSSIPSAFVVKAIKL